MPSVERLLPLALDIQPLPFIERIRAFRDLATHSLTDALIVSQRVGAVRFIQECAPSPFTEELRARAQKEFLITQAVSHIAPSYTGSTPAVTIQTEPAGLVVRGKAPWVTGIGMVEYVATGATAQDGMQFIVLLPRRHPGLTFSLSEDLVALRESETGSMLIDSLSIQADQIVLGPENKLTTHRAGKFCVGYPPLSTSMLALGHAQRCLQNLEAAASKTPLFEPIAVQLAEQIHEVGDAIELQGRVTTPPSSHEVFEELRAQANCVALQAAHLAAAAAGGQGFLQGTLVSQLSAESRFFLVWALSPRAKVRTMELLAQGVTRPVVQ